MILALAEQAKAKGKTRSFIPYRNSKLTRVLQESLVLLHRHYNARYRHDVLLFHTGDFDERGVQRRVLEGVAEAAALNTTRFVRVPDQHWSVRQTSVACSSTSSARSQPAAPCGVLKGSYSYTRRHASSAR